MTTFRWVALAFLLPFALGSCTKKDPVVPIDGPEPTEETVAPVSFEFEELISAQVERQRLQLNWLATDFSTTGLYAPAFSTIKIQVEQMAGARLPQLLIGTYSRYGGWNSEPAVFALSPGENEFTISGQGLIWVRYTTDGTPDSKAKLTFTAGFRPVPHYQYGKTTNTEWIKMLNDLNTVPDVVLEGEKCYIVVSRQSAIAHQHFNQDELLKKISRIVTIEDDYSGLDGSSERDKPNAHKKYLLTQHEDPSYYMFAYNYRTAYTGSAISTILNPVDVTWGPWHELGHLHQQIWTWPAISEVTVNIFSRAVQREFTPHENRLVIDRVWEKVPIYLARSAAEKDFNSDAVLDVWVRLCMFEQLRLAFGEDFYPNLHKKVRL
ncbi:MAG TPA: M60 family metallopeptidase, partial [Sphingobacteriaceae bacterium]|nr:M60 family metallopeptidase [Sphingobacteriaceae bacterium]